MRRCSVCKEVKGTQEPRVVARELDNLYRMIRHTSFARFEGVKSVQNTLVSGISSLTNFFAVNIYTLKQGR